MPLFAMRTRWRNESDRWTVAVSKITEAAKLSAVRDVLENRGPIIVERWYYRGASAPSRHVFEDYEAFTAFLNDECFAGDIIDIWDWSKVCKTEDALASGKCPDEKGQAPQGGAY